MISSELFYWGSFTIVILVIIIVSTIVTSWRRKAARAEMVGDGDSQPVPPADELVAWADSLNTYAGRHRAGEDDDTDLIFMPSPHPDLGWGKKGEVTCGVED